ncbi:MAG TPA: amidohydrolase [Solirubrobacteraceae bacterium]|nr:amidohydrolase [Solirubrobacteraceae bacterium]
MTGEPARRFALVNARVRPLAGPPLAGGLVVADGRVERLLGAGEAPPADLPAHDLGGRCVIPGLVDAHTHFGLWALSLKELSLRDARSAGEVAELVAERAADGDEWLTGGATERAADGDEWLTAGGWREQVLGPVERATLDRAVPGRPVALVASDRHTLWLNSAALERAEAAGVLGGADVVERDGGGRPTGVLREVAAWRVRDRFLLPSLDRLTEAIAEALPLAHARGVTAVHDKDGWIGIHRAWARLRAAGRLRLRVFQSLPATEGAAAAARAAAEHSDPEWLRIGYLKLFADGTLGSGTALLSDGRGTQVTAPADLRRLVAEAADAGLPVAVHAIGDRATKQVIDAFEATEDRWRPAGLRQRIEHAQLLAPRDLDRMAALGISASVQFPQLLYDRDVRGLPAGVLHHAHRTMLEAGVRLASGSDCPIDDLDPIAALAAGVTRTSGGREPWQPGERLTVEQALVAATGTPAWIEGREGERGALTPGRAADAVVLDDDPFTVDPARLASLRVVATMVAGEWVHGAPRARAEAVA